MTAGLLLCAIILAVVLVVAGIAKLADRAGSLEAARGFGLPEPVASGFVLCLAGVELAIAALLLPAATRWWAAVAALVLLLVFCAAIARAMARGEAPECHCFGQLHSAPAGWSTLARNAALAGMAAFVVIEGRDDPGPGAFAWVSGLDGVEWALLGLGVALAATLAVGGCAVVHVLRSYGSVLVRLERVEERLRSAGLELEDPDEMPQVGLSPGTVAPAFWLPSADGDRVALADLLEPGRPLLLLFTSPSCGPCSVLMPEIARWQREHGDELTIALLSDGDPELVRADAAEHGLDHVLVDETLAAYEAYQANGTPSAVLVGDDGTIASWLAAGGDWIETLIQQALAGLGRTPGLPVGSEVPPARLETLTGETKGISELVTAPTVVLFWNPGCGYCRALRDDVRSWEERSPDGAPALVVISSGTSDEVREEGFASPVLLDPDWAVAGAFGADGTPMAVLLGVDGRVAASLVTGGAAALALLGARDLARS